MDRETFTNQMQWSFTFSLCFLISIVLQQFGWRAIAHLDAHTWAQAYWHFFWWLVVFAPFVASFILTLRGYVHLGTHLNTPFLKGATYFAITAYSALAALVSLGALVSMHIPGAGSGPVMQTLVPFVLTLFLLGCVNMSFSLITQRKQLGNVVLPFFVFGIGISLYMTFAYLSQVFAPELMSLLESRGGEILLQFLSPLFKPYLEALIALCSAFIFWRASQL